MCLRYVIDGETKETFAGFYKTDSTEGEVLYELVKAAVSTLELSLGNIIAECFDGAVNMSRAQRSRNAHKAVFTTWNLCSLLWSQAQLGPPRHYDRNSATSECARHYAEPLQFSRR